jgi:hypothetical protein
LKEKASRWFDPLPALQPRFFGAFSKEAEEDFNYTLEFLVSRKDRKGNLAER